MMTEFLLHPHEALSCKTYCRTSAFYLYLRLAMSWQLSILKLGIRATAWLLYGS